MYGVVLHAHLVRGESHNQRNTTGEVATIPKAKNFSSYYAQFPLHNKQLCPWEVSSLDDLWSFAVSHSLMHFINRCTWQRCTGTGVSESTPAGVLTIFENRSGDRVDISKEEPEPVFQ